MAFLYLLLEGFRQLSWSCGETDLHGVPVSCEHLRPLAPGRTVALVNDNVGEEDLRVIGGKEAGVAVLVIHSQSLVGGNVDASILGVIGTIGLAVDLGSISTKDVLEGLESLGAQFVAVAYERARVSWPASEMRLSRFTAMKVLPEPVASDSNARLGCPATSHLATFSMTARIAAS